MGHLISRNRLYKPNNKHKGLTQFPEVHYTLSLRYAYLVVCVVAAAPPIYRSACLIVSPAYLVNEFLEFNPIAISQIEPKAFFCRSRITVTLNEYPEV